ncbi:hypothetical protein B5P45_02905 [Phyllobacterium zundukense]|uniref:Uncharacterized protein n=1 Tax=Phyllobacterium zundukense TaxID=1867719 RepID=A0A2N9W4U4_9HYPH|nr:hypothetical protein BLM14_09170 [Phyllobacterium zundukense]PIO46762.1 hypothetical protein B5P45_02905 [Phyllobacterium zundukense]
MLEISHCHCDLTITTAARWLASQKRPPAAVLSVLHERFGLSIEEAGQAVREARLIHARAL